MSKMSDLYCVIHSMSDDGYDLAYIANNLGLTEHFVSAAFSEEETVEEEFDDSMDGDFDSAMESCGWGYDEQYTGWAYEDC